MAKDHFKEYIQQHKADFDDAAVPQNMLPGIMTRMEKRSVRIKKSKYFTAVAACLAGFLLLFHYFPFHQPGIKESVPVVVVQKENPVAAPEKVHQSLPEPKQVAAVPAAGFRTKIKNDDRPYREIYAGLQDSSSAARRIEAVLAIGDMTSPDRQLTSLLYDTFNDDESSNVHLEALNVLIQYAGDPLVQKRLVRALRNQKDPFIQMELVRAVGNNTDPETTKKLVEISDDPFTIPPVKEQVYFALLTR
ncbi:MAG: HEAT repeat domain-containing protein [Chitinophagaceae bacterium]|nr:HEAT repeat domain-containing protein [Chitinophagaceae bacterium]